jgi:hypothetical protein
LKTFIDESGSFAKSTTTSVSVIGALTCRDSTSYQLEADFTALKSSWGMTGEPKHGKLDEVKIIQVVEM